MIAIILGALVVCNCDGHKDNGCMAVSACALGLLALVGMIIMIILLAIGGILVTEYVSSRGHTRLYTVDLV